MSETAFDKFRKEQGEKARKFILDQVNAMNDSALLVLAGLVREEFGGDAVETTPTKQKKPVASKSNGKQQRFRSLSEGSAAFEVLKIISAAGKARCDTPYLRKQLDVVLPDASKTAVNAATTRLSESGRIAESGRGKNRTYSITKLGLDELKRGG